LTGATRLGHVWSTCNDMNIEPEEVVESEFRMLSQMLGDSSQEITHAKWSLIKQLPIRADSSFLSNYCVQVSPGYTMVPYVLTLDELRRIPEFEMRIMNAIQEKVRRINRRYPEMVALYKERARSYFVTDTKALTERLVTIRSILNGEVTESPLRLATSREVRAPEPGSGPWTGAMGWLLNCFDRTRRDVAQGREAAIPDTPGRHLLPRTQNRVLLHEAEALESLIAQQQRTVREARDAYVQSCLLRLDPDTPWFDDPAATGWKRLERPLKSCPHPAMVEDFTTEYTIDLSIRSVEEAIIAKDPSITRLEVLEYDDRLLEFNVFSKSTLERTVDLLISLEKGEYYEDAKASWSLSYPLGTQAVGRIREELLERASGSLHRMDKFEKLKFKKFKNYLSSWEPKGYCYLSAVLASKIRNTRALFL